MGVLNAIGNQIRKFHFLRQAHAPWWVIGNFYTLHTSHYLSNRRGKNHYRARKEAFWAQKDNLALDNDWFTGNVPTWLRLFDNEGLYRKPELNCLEIGSWQGLSAYFLLSALKNARLTCVDTWEGADEHKAGTGTRMEVLSQIERTFDANLVPFGERVRKYKGTSLSYYAAHFEPSVFDLIYVDGSHHSDDVAVDAVKCFGMLKVGGIMIFDDYFWHYYRNVVDNPASAINTFLRLKRDCLKIVGFDYQLAIRKTAESARFSKKQPSNIASISRPRRRPAAVGGRS